MIKNIIPPDYPCHFCQQVCKPRKKKMTKNRYWHLCKNCPSSVGFLVSLQGKLSEMDFSFPDPDQEKNRYCVKVDYEEGSSTISYWTHETYTSAINGKKYKHYICKELAKLNFCVKNFTPLNVQKKLSLYLPFL
jgi:hypothetical protein